MNKLLLLLILLLLFSADALAKGPANVTAGRHNFASTSTNYYKSDNEDEVCIFCHTPHGGALNGPLWNHSQGVTNFTHYSSATLTITALGLLDTRAVSQESLLCLSCHDGSVAINSLLNYSNRTGAAVTNPGPIVGGFWGAAQGALIGSAWDGSAYSGTNLLTDDHPISFSYFRVAEETVANNNKFRTTNEAELAGVRFFPPGQNGANGDNTTKRVECSSCHDPHVQYEGAGGDPSYTPFLITSNNASALCLACHVK